MTEGVHSNHTLHVQQPSPGAALSPAHTFPKDVLILFPWWIAEQLRHDKLEVFLHSMVYIRETEGHGQCTRDAYIHTYIHTYIQYCMEGEGYSAVLARLALRGMCGYQWSVVLLYMEV